MKKFLIGLAITTVLLITALIFVINRYELAGKEIGLEIAKTILQVIVIIFLGQFISFLISEHDRNKQEKNELNAFKRALLTRLDRMNSNALKAIHNLRIKGLIYDAENKEIASAQIKTEEYHNQMQLIYELQHELRNIREEIKNFTHKFSNPDEILRSIKAILEYAKQLIQEYESYCKILDPMSITLPIKNLPGMIGLLTPFDESEPRKEYGKHYGNLFKLIREDIFKS